METSKEKTISSYIQCIGRYIRHNVHWMHSNYLSVLLSNVMGTFFPEAYIFIIKDIHAIVWNLIDIVTSFYENKINIFVKVVHSHQLKFINDVIVVTYLVR